MTDSIFITVKELIDFRDNVARGNAVSMSGALYEDSVENLNALRMLEPSLRELVEICTNSGMEAKALDEVRHLLGMD